MLLINLKVPAPPFPSPNYLTFKKISKLFIPLQCIKQMLSTVKLKNSSAHNYRLFAMKPWVIPLQSADPRHWAEVWLPG